MCASVQHLHRKHQRHGARDRIIRRRGRGGDGGGRRKRRGWGTDLGRSARDQAGNDYILRERSAERLQLWLLLEDSDQVSLPLESAACPLARFNMLNERGFLLRSTLRCESDARSCQSVDSWTGRQEFCFFLSRVSHFRSSICSPSYNASWV